MTGKFPASVLAGFSFIGRGGGPVKALSGFRKGHHTLPDVANATTNAFLGKICEEELSALAEKYFQAVRAGLGYKRKEVSLAVTSPTAVLSARDFTLDFFYALDDRDPARFAATTTLHDLKNADLARTEEFAAIFAGMFNELSFALKKGASVESIIDVIEALDGEGGLKVAYPSDYRECEISVDGVDARVRCSGASLEMIFPRAGSPRELMEGFAEVRGAFSVSRELSGMIG